MPSPLELAEQQQEASKKQANAYAAFKERPVRECPALQLFKLTLLERLPRALLLDQLYHNSPMPYWKMKESSYPLLGKVTGTMVLTRRSTPSQRPSFPHVSEPSQSYRRMYAVSSGSTSCLIIKQAVEDHIHTLFPV